MNAGDISALSVSELTDRIVGDRGTALHVASELLVQRERADRLQGELDRETKRLDGLIRATLPPAPPEFGWRGVLRRAAVPLVVFVGGMAALLLAGWLFPRLFPGWCG
jgi:hypothetical protein